jgi:hypothetical protein
MSSILSRLKRVTEEELDSMAREKHEEEQQEDQKQQQQQEAEEEEEEEEFSQESNPFVDADANRDRRAERPDIAFHPVTFKSLPMSSLVWAPYSYYRPKGNVS